MVNKQQVEKKTISIQYEVLQGNKLDNVTVTWKDELLTLDKVVQVASLSIQMVLLEDLAM